MSRNIFMLLIIIKLFAFWQGDIIQTVSETL